MVVSACSPKPAVKNSSEASSEEESSFETTPSDDGDASGEEFDESGSISDSSDMISGTSSKKTSPQASTKTTPSKRPSPVVSAPKEGYDLSGRVSDMKGRTIRFTVGYRADTDPASADGVLNAKNIERIEKKYNCKIEIVPNEPYTTISSIVAGKPDTDIWNLTNSDFFTSVYRGRYIQSLEDLKCLDLSDTKTFSSNTGYFKINGKHWAVNPQTYGITSIAVNTLLAANKSMLAAKGVSVSDIYALQDAGKWTWDEFQKIAKKVTNPSGDVYAIQDKHALFYQSLLASNSTDFIEMKSGTLTFTGDSAAAKKVMTYYSNLAADKSLNTIAGAANSFSDGWDDFLAGKNYFYCGVVALHSPQWRFIKDRASDFALFHIPKPTESAPYTSFISGICPYVIPVFTGSDADLRSRCAATVMSELFSPLKSEAEYAVELKTACLLAAGGDKKGQSTLLKLFDATVFSYSYMGSSAVTTPNDNPKTGWLDLIHSIANNPTSFQSVVDSRKSEYTSFLSEVLKR